MTGATVVTGATVAIVGAGASGAAVAWRLATAGVDVVCLERGDWLDQSKSPSLGHDWERALQTRFNANPNIRRGPADDPVVDDDTEIQPALFNGVGGGLLRWGAHFPRLRPSDFRVRSLDGVGEDWPLGYADLEPYYDLNDSIMGVAGLLGDPGNPPRHAERDPPLPLGPGGLRLVTGFERLGWHWWPSDAAILTRARPGRASCNNCGPCGVGCLRGARASVDNTYWPAAIAAGARLVTGVRVTRIATADRGRRAAVIVYREADGTERRLEADHVVLAANGMGTARLLLASPDRDHPDGLANGTGLVGRNLMHHPTAIVTGVFDERLDGHKGPFASALYCQEFYETDRSRGAVRGLQLQMLRGSGPVATALGGYMARLPWGRDHHAEFKRQFARSVTLTVTVEDLPEPDNRVTLDPGRRDVAGMPLARLAYRVGENSRRLLAFGIERAREALHAAGARDVVVNPLSRAAGFHFLGTARAGTDPAGSVVDAQGRAHGVGNLWIVDGSVFPTSGAVNPTPTIQAFALRAADAMLRTLKP
ncbi:MAG: GMC family oxidoreductase [Alphaproteobacteria bacterium]|nr:GMC family oxidoreductase [Alphaproteobacteria bacterium]